MMSFQMDGYLEQSLIEERDAIFGVSTEDKEARRAGIPVPEKDPLADYWFTSGKALVFTTEEVDMIWPDGTTHEMNMGGG